MRRATIISLGLTLVALGCSSDTSEGEPAGAGGGAGQSGASGKGGGGGAAGAAGGAGGAGQGGAAGQGGGGAAGAAGGAGQGGTAGGAGQGGTAGQAGAGGAGGSGQGGVAGASGGGGAAGSAGAGEAQGCADSSDCAANALRKTCDVTVGKCVGCLPLSDGCGPGTYCRPDTKLCATGCNEDADCGADKPLCSLPAHACVQCLDDAQCADGFRCDKGSCAQGCSDTKPCLDASQTCCGGTCHALGSETNHCGACGQVCPLGNHATSVCASGSCALGACEAGFLDCDGRVDNGCEVDATSGGACVCVPGSTKPCYEGPAGTDGVGTCHGGVQVCAPSGMGYIPGCTGQVLPQPEQCGDGLDHDCNGAANDVPDVDGDGWNACQGDCCEYTYQCGTPALVNPGAYDVPGDGVDDDCNGSLGPLDCSIGQKFSGVQAQDLAAAMDLCQTTAEGAPLPQKTWGVISAQLLLASGAQPGPQQLSDMQNWQSAVLTDYGATGPRRGPSMVGMSSGRMRDKGDPGYVPPNGGLQFNSTSSPPASYLAAHANALPASAGCSGGCQAGAGANDSVLLRLRVRVPTNAKSLSYDFRFYSSEFWTYQCTQFNDFYLAQLQTSAPGIPADRNISFDSLNNPVSVNNGFFEVCQQKGCNVCPSGTGDLAGTGMEDITFNGSFGSGVTGGATKWLTTVAPVVPGEIITLDFSIFDVSDYQLDSLALLDNFTWLATPSSGPSTGPAK